MIRWLKIMRAEFLRDIKTSLRYPVELFMGIFVLFVLFMAVFTGAKLLAGGAAQSAFSGGIDRMVIGYTMWFFAIMAINTMSLDIEVEARAGTLEQVYIHAPSFFGLTWMRSITHLCLGAGAVAALSLLIQFTTHHFLHATVATALPMLLVIVLTVGGTCGFGLILGGLSLVFKRIGQLSAIVQFSLFFMAYTDLSKLPPPWYSIASHLPLGRGVSLLTDLQAPESSFAGIAGGVAWLALDSLCYVVIGSLVFLAMDRLARKSGTLSHY